MASDPFVTAALKGEEMAGSANIPEEELALDKLDSQAKIELVPTETGWQKSDWNKDFSSCI